MPYRFHFEDKGQDILTIDVSNRGTITDVQPFHARLYKGNPITVKPSTIKKGDYIGYFDDEAKTRNFIWPVVKVEQIS